MTPRLRFWLFAMEVAYTLRLPECIYLWAVRQASNSVDWSRP